ncbi:MAG: hypothetical protein ABSC92_18880 [Rhizomicrobium sp.]
MKTQRLAIILAGTAVLLASLPALAADKVTGVDKDFLLLSESTALVPDKPGHSVQQRTWVWSTSSPQWGEYWNSAVEQGETVGTDDAVKGYGTSHFPDGGVTYFVWEGTSKFTAKDGGGFEVAGQGKFTWLGGTGKHDVKGPGTYTCKFTQTGGGCDWQTGM